MSNPNAGTRGTKEINKNYPVDKGLGDEDRHEGTEINLKAEEGSNVFSKERALL